MYFMPKANKWYRWAVHTKATYRYGMSCAILLILILGWWYGIYAWFDTAIKTSQVAISQLQKQTIQLAKAERLSGELHAILPIMRRQLQEFCPSSVSAWQQQQFDCVMHEAQKTGVAITGYNDENGKKKSWGSYRRVQLSLNGTMEHIINFLRVMQQSHLMIQCNQIQISRLEGAACSASCQLKFMMAAA